MPGVKTSLTGEESGSAWVAFPRTHAIVGGVTCTPSPGPRRTARPPVAQPPSLHNLAVLKATVTSSSPDPKGVSLSRDSASIGHRSPSPPVLSLQLSSVYNPSYEYSCQARAPGAGKMVVTDSDPCRSYTLMREAHIHQTTTRVNVRLQW